MNDHPKQRVTDSPGNFFASLISSDDRRTDSITISGCVAIVVAALVFGYDVVVKGHEAQLLSFGGCVASIIGAMAGGKTVRDRFSDAPPVAAAKASEV